jgi:hypothetical protein
MAILIIVGGVRSTLDPARSISEWSVSARNINDALRGGVSVLLLKGELDEAVVIVSEIPFLAIISLVRLFPSFSELISRSSQVHVEEVSIPLVVEVDSSLEEIHFISTISIRGLVGINSSQQLESLYVFEVFVTPVFIFSIIIFILPVISSIATFTCAFFFSWHFIIVSTISIVINSVDVSKEPKGGKCG